jgi:hypothetical protein
MNVPRSFIRFGRSNSSNTTPRVGKQNQFQFFNNICAFNKRQNFHNVSNFKKDVLEEEQVDRKFNYNLIIGLGIAMGLLVSAFLNQRIEETW